MSIEAVKWAIRQRPPKPADKLVLWIIADTLNRSTAEAYPSVAAICDGTGLNRKMVIDSIARLTRLGLIVDTGRRVGRTGQVKVWTLPLDGAEQGEQSPIGDA